MSHPSATHPAEARPDIRRPFFQPRRLGHANIWVSDYQRSFGFYNRVLGFNEAYTQPDNRAVFVTNGNSHHDFGMVDVTSHYAKPGQQPGLNHIGIELRNEVELVDGYRRALASDIEFAAVADHDVAHSLYLKDPDGNEVELYADVVPDWRAVRSGVVIKAKPKYVPGVSSKPIEQEMFVRNPVVTTVEGAVFHPIRTGHVSLIADDYEAMYDFYVDVVGLTALASGRSSDFAILQGTHSSGDVVLHRRHGGLKPGLHHVGVQLQDERDFDGAERALTELGVPIDSQIEHRARRAMTVLDQDSIRIQMFANRDWRAPAVDGLEPRAALQLL
jgi:catechol 2,3-dioxygenase